MIKKLILLSSIVLSLIAISSTKARTGYDYGFLGKTPNTNYYPYSFGYPAYYYDYAPTYGYYGNYPAYYWY